MVPTQVTPNDVQLRGDPWSCQINLDPAHDWSHSTFTVDTAPHDLPVVVDASHRGDPAPFLVLTLPATATTAAAGTSFRWHLAETPLLARTFLSRVVELRPR